MPKSKRAKVVHLSKVEKKGKDLSIKLYNNVQDAATRYRYCFVFAVDNMRNNYLKDVRAQFSESRLFFGKTRVMAKALGTSPEDEYLPNLSNISPHLTGHVGLLFTDQDTSTIVEYFDTYSETDFARAGATASRTVIVPAGVVYSRAGQIPQDDDVPVLHSQESSLRQYGMPTRMEKGKVVLDDPYEICREGQAMNSHQTSLLKMFGISMAEFRINVKAYYDSTEQNVIELGSSDVMKEN